MSGTIETAEGAAQLSYFGTENWWRPLLALLLIAAADFLTLRHMPGLGVALFALAVGLVLLFLAKWEKKRRNTAGPALFAFLCILPLFESIGPLSLLTAATGLGILALSAAGLLAANLLQWPLAVLGFALRAPTRLFADTMGLIAKTGSAGATSGRPMSRRAGRIVATAIVPTVLGVIFLGLFRSANPLLERALDVLDFTRLTVELDAGRILFWGFMLFTIWPLLRPRLLPFLPVATLGKKDAFAPAGENLLFGRTAILSSLILFNLMFAVQSATDIIYLWGGMTLPDGMSYAEYAHRGAYPLIVTALLAAAFILVAMRRNGPAETAPVIRLLVYVFVAQNILLVVSSILRLERYVEVYLLTELRVAAFIWMALVAVGLALILARIVLHRDNHWLISANLWALGMVLFACSTVDFPALIARYNVENSTFMRGGAAQTDIWHFKDLGPGALPALYDLLEKGRMDQTFQRDLKAAIYDLRVEFGRREVDWRAWNWRDARLQNFLETKHGFPSNASPDNISQLD